MVFMKIALLLAVLLILFAIYEIIGLLKKKAEVMLMATHEFKGYEIAYEGLSMEEM